MHAQPECIDLFMQAYALESTWFSSHVQTTT